MGEPCEDDQHPDSSKNRNPASPESSGSKRAQGEAEDEASSDQPNPIGPKVAGDRKRRRDINTELEEFRAMMEKLPESFRVQTGENLPKRGKKKWTVLGTLNEVRTTLGQLMNTNAELKEEKQQLELKVTAMTQEIKILRTKVTAMAKEIERLKNKFKDSSLYQKMGEPTEDQQPDYCTNGNPEQPESSRSKRVRSGEKLVDGRGKAKVEVSSSLPKRRGQKPTKTRKANSMAGGRNRMLEINTELEELRPMKPQLAMLRNDNAGLKSANQQLKRTVTALEQKIKTLKGTMSVNLMNLNILQELFDGQNSLMGFDFSENPDDANGEPMTLSKSDFLEGVIDSIDVQFPTPCLATNYTQGTGTSKTGMLKHRLTQVLSECEKLTATSNDKIDNKIPSTCHNEELATNKHITEGIGTSLTGICHDVMEKLSKFVDKPGAGKEASAKLNYLKMEVCISLAKHFAKQCIEQEKASAQREEDGANKVTETAEDDD